MSIHAAPPKLARSAIVWLAACLTSISLTGCAEEPSAYESNYYESNSLADMIVDALAVYEVPVSAIRFDASAANQGFQVNRVSHQLNSLSLYTVFNYPFNGQLRIKVLDYNGLEIGRSTKRVTQPADSALHLTFEFEMRTQLDEAEYFVLSKI